MPPALAVWSLNHWTTREVPPMTFASPHSASQIPGNPGQRGDGCGNLKEGQSRDLTPSPEGRGGCRKRPERCTLSVRPDRETAAWRHLLGRGRCSGDRVGQPGRGRVRCGGSRAPVLRAVPPLNIQVGAAGSALTWDSDLDDIWIFWFDFDGSQPTQLPRGSCKTRGRQGIRSGAGVNLAQRARSLLNTPLSGTC